MTDNGSKDKRMLFEDLLSDRFAHWGRYSSKQWQF